MNRPEKNEYAEFYADYVALVAETDIIAALRNQPVDLRNLLAGISPEKENDRYAENKWSVREMIGHLIDGERVFSYRALRFSRGDKISLAGFEQDSYVAESNFSATKLTDLIEEFSLLRQSNVLFFKNLTEEMWDKDGTASDAKISVRALAFVMVGHVAHHVKILQTRYL